MLVLGFNPRMSRASATFRSGATWLDPRDKPEDDGERM
jgi:hypothetical protein